MLGASVPDPAAVLLSRTIPPPSKACKSVAPCADPFGPIRLTEFPLRPADPMILIDDVALVPVMTLKPAFNTVEPVYVLLLNRLIPSVPFAVSTPLGL